VFTVCDARFNILDSAFLLQRLAFSESLWGMGLYNIEENYPLKKLMMELGGIYRLLMSTESKVQKFCQLIVERVLEKLAQNFMCIYVSSYGELRIN
jgi:hypothetical protein